MKKRKKRMTRRSALKFLGGTAGAVLTAPMINIGKYELFAASKDKYSARTMELMERSLVIDMTIFLTMNAEKEQVWLKNPDSYPEEEWEKVKTSGINVYSIHRGLGWMTSEDLFKSVVTYFTYWNNFIANHDRLFMRIDSLEDLNRVKRSGKIGLMIGMQNGTHFQSVDDVNFFYGLGQRVSHLTYNHRTLLGSGCMERSDGGLSDFGVAIVERMNEVGMAVDSAHAGDRTALDTFEVSKKPVIISHSNCRALVPKQPRCVPDEIIRKIANKGGVIGMTFCSNFVRDKDPTTIEHVVNHFDHVAKIVGVEHVGVGSDCPLNGHQELPPEMFKKMLSKFDPRYAFREKLNIEGLDHPKRTYDLTEAFIRRGYSDADIEGMLGGNFKRVLSEIWSL